MMGLGTPKTKDKAIKILFDNKAPPVLVETILEWVQSPPPRYSPPPKSSLSKRSKTLLSEVAEVAEDPLLRSRRRSWTSW